MTRWIAFLLMFAAAPVAAETAVVVIQGLGGNAHYQERFDEEVSAIEAASRTLTPEPSLRVFREAAADRETILAYLDVLAARLSDDDTLLLYLVGHGSYDDETYKFNITGPDLTDADVKAALDKITGARQVVINTSSASGAAAEAWQDERRILISATRSGRERHATHFGQYFARALSHPAADIDKNRIVSAQEAFDFADRQVSDRFETSGNLPTEHARLDGERAARFSLARLDSPTVAAGDAELDALTRDRDAIAGRIDTLRLSRDDMTPDEYQEALLGLMLELATAEEAMENRQAELGNE